MHDRDCLHRFLFERYPIRGHLVHLDAAWRALTLHREYPAAIRDMLGEAVAASLLLAATIKFEGVLSLQLQGDGPVHLVLAQCTSGLGVRGLARSRERVHTGEHCGASALSGTSTGTVTDTVTDAGGVTRTGGTGAGGVAGAGDGSSVSRIADLLGTGNLTVTLETDEGAQRYQGIVPIAGERLAESLQVYFENSEQLPTRLWLHADAAGACGMLLQKLPGADAPGVHGAEVAAVDDAWRRVQLIGETLTSKELRTLADAEILHRLFNEDDVRLFEPAPVYFRCRCSRERVSGMLQGLGEVETRAVLLERGDVEVRCDFCNRAYVFDAVDVAQLFNAAAASVRGSSVH